MPRSPTVTAPSPLKSPCATDAPLPKLVARIPRSPTETDRSPLASPTRLPKVKTLGDDNPVIAFALIVTSSQPLMIAALGVGLFQISVMRSTPAVTARRTVTDE